MQPPAENRAQQPPYQPSFGPASQPQEGTATTTPVLPPEAGTAVEPTVTQERVDELRTEIETLRTQAEQSAELDEEKKKKIVELCAKAAAKIKESQESAAKVESLAKESTPEAIQQRLELVKQALAEQQKRKPESFVDVPLPELEQRMAKQELDLTDFRAKMAMAEGAAQRRSDRRKTYRERIAEIRNKQFPEIRQKIEAISTDENPLIAQATKVDLSAQFLVLFQQIKLMEAEQLKFDAEDAVDLPRFERDLAAQRFAVEEQNLKAMAEQVKVKRAAAAQEAVQQARQQLILVQPVLRKYAERNQQLAETTQEITKKREQVDKADSEATETLTKLKEKFNDTKAKVNQLGLTNTIGVLLRKQRTELLEKTPLQSGSLARQALIDEAQFKQFDYSDESKELANIEPYVEQVMAESAIQDPAEQRQLELAAREVFEQLKSNINKLETTNQGYIDRMVDLRGHEAQIAEEIDKYLEYIDKRVLWIRSGNVLATELQMDDSDREFLAASAWVEVGQALWSDLKRNLLVYVVVVSVFVGLVIKHGRLKNDLRGMGEQAQKAGFFGFWPTTQAMLCTLLLSAVNPGILAFFAWRLMSAPSFQTFAVAVGKGLFWTAVMWFPLEIMRNVCRGKGLGESHFKWPESSLRLLGRSMAWLTPAILPLTFITSTFYASDPTHGHDAIERLCFIVQMILLAGFLGRILHPTGVFQEYIAYNQDGWFDRLKYVWYWAAVLAPLCLAGLAFWGYYYTAQVLSWRLFATLCCVLGVMLIRAALMRWIMLARRKLSIAQARERASAAAAQSGDSAAASLSTSIVAEQAKEELSSHSAQTQRLLSTGMFTASLIGVWLIWGNVMPALSMLDQYSYTIETTSDVAANSDDAITTMPGMPAAESEEKDADSTATATAVTPKTTTRKITIVTAAFACLILVLTLVFARDIPGLMEMAILQRLPLEASIRYAITTMASYAIVMIGTIWAFSTIGLKWEQIQWLATALTFGLAFGLQEMFANFVAGIIILFERPIRVGDIVTIHDVTGVVSRIRIRATSITNWDRKEYVVPNKEFITGRLLNWTLSDTVNRVVINVGIAYGADTEEARRLLVEIAERNPYMMKDPPPLATFEGFGDSTLNLVLRCYLPNLENRLQVINDLHTSIDKAFRDAQIEIAFPQRDLHIRTAPGVAAALGIPEGKSAAEPGSQQDPKRGAA